MVTLMNGYVLVEEFEVEKAGSIIIPDCAKIPMGMGIVKNVGTGHYAKGGVHIPPRTKNGDKIAFNTGFRISADKNNKNLIFIKEEDILGIMED